MPGPCPSNYCTAGPTVPLLLAPHRNYPRLILIVMMTNHNAWCCVWPIPLVVRQIFIYHYNKTKTIEVTTVQSQPIEQTQSISS